MNNLTDNMAHRALFTLPPIRPSAETAPAVQALPLQKVVTGDKEVDAVLWLREVIKTGQAGPIATALDAAKQIKTPLKVIEQRYTDYVRRNSGGNPFAALFAFGFSDLDNLAAKSLEKASLAAEARARFDGEAIWGDTPAEQFCEKALKRCRGYKGYIDNDKAQVANRFRKQAGLMPNTLDDCLHEIAYWGQLYALRSAVGERGDGMHEAISREWFVESLLSEIAPRSQNEALRVLDYAEYAAGVDDVRLMAIARNLVRSGFKTVSETENSAEAPPRIVTAPDWPFHHDYTNPDVAGAAVLDCMTAFEKSMRAQGFEVEVKK